MSDVKQLCGKLNDMRVCLTCRKPFISLGIYNRICGSCKKTEEFTGASYQSETGLLPK